MTNKCKYYKGTIEDGIASALNVRNHIKTVYPLVFLKLLKPDGSLATVLEDDLRANILNLVKICVNFKLPFCFVMSPLINKDYVLNQLKTVANGSVKIQAIDQFAYLHYSPTIRNGTNSSRS